MSVSQSDVDSAGSAYSTAIAAAIAAYVTLAATERKMDQQGTALAGGGRFGSETDNIDLHPWCHVKYAPTVSASRLEDLIRTRLAQL
jgi:hypothetical protein